MVWMSFDINNTSINTIKTIVNHVSIPRTAVKRKKLSLDTLLKK